MIKGHSSTREWLQIDSYVFTLYEAMTSWLVVLGLCALFADSYGLPSKDFRPHTSELIQNGNRAPKYKFPHVVLVSNVWVHDLSGNRTKNCTGTILTPKHILTAAQCTEAGDFSAIGFWVFAGYLNRDDPDPKEVQKVWASTFTRHPNYVRDYLLPGNHHDLAILHLDDPLEFSRLVQPTVIPKTDQFMKNIPHFWSVGYGAIGYANMNFINSKVLRYGETPLVDRDECNRRLAYVHRGALGDLELCTELAVEDGWARGILQGDNGGPLLIAYEVQVQVATIRGSVDDDQYQLDQDKRPAVHTRLAPYCNWLHEVTGNSYSCL
ncbi:hypothetical protein L596_009643 [Steinernema carpocapsae]|uniref:Peptidase S1 domain-containing protein n=1 Tax=Steinernema carpocapsae TaxID=34508 RepID=A0A4U5PG51_STECR|nr:hypothetical protein L596_009643 [Steinernema carpocapsae]